MECKKCGFSLAPKEIYCTKCGFNNMLEYKGEKKQKPRDTIHYKQTSAQEKEKYRHTNRGIGLALLISVLCIAFLWYSVLSGMWSAISFPILENLPIKTLQYGLYFITGAVVIESILSYRFPDDNYLVSLFKYCLLLFVLYALFIGYTFLETHVFSLGDIHWLSFLLYALILGTVYFICKTLVWKLMEHWVTHNYVVYLLFYYTFRMALWIGLLYLTNYVLPL